MTRHLTHINNQIHPPYKPVTDYYKSSSLSSKLRREATSFFLVRFTHVLFYFKWLSTTLQLYHQSALFHSPFVLLSFYFNGNFSPCKLIFYPTINPTPTVGSRIATILEKEQTQLQRLSQNFCWTAAGSCSRCSRDDRVENIASRVTLLSLLTLFQYIKQYYHQNEQDYISRKIGLLSKPDHALSDRDLLDLYEFAGETPWRNWLCYSSAQDLHLSDGFHPTVGISPSCTETIPLVLTRETARIRSMQEPERRANRRGISIDIDIIFVKMIREKWIPLENLDRSLTL